jgi:hypothetical protein
MRAISLHQPHATFVALGLKPFEMRHWETDNRGPLLIHAAKRQMRDCDYELWFRVYAALSKTEAGRALIAFQPFRQPPPYGAFVCIVDLVDVRPAESLSAEDKSRSNGLGDFSAGRFAWDLRDVRRLKTTWTARGRQSFWNVNMTFEPCEVEPMNQIIL